MYQFEVFPIHVEGFRSRGDHPSLRRDLEAAIDRAIQAQEGPREIPKDDEGLGRPLREVHVFMVYLPTKYGREDLEFFKDFVVKATKSAKVPTLEFDGMVQNHGVVITVQEDWNDYEWRRKNRTNWLESEEKRLKPKEGEESQDF
jgi:hypothetical protein